ncbi:MAG: hypothetical protein GY838_13500 [bacterium]|nr:hypothetical protein [bacterium]
MAKGESRNKLNNREKSHYVSVLTDSAPFYPTLVVMAKNNADSAAIYAEALVEEYSFNSEVVKDLTFVVAPTAITSLGLFCVTQAGFAGRAIKAPI